MKFKVKFLTPEGEVIEEEVEANDITELYTMYADREYILLDYSRNWLEIAKHQLKASNLFSKITKQELADFCFYLGRSLEMGISLLETLEDIKGTTKNKYFQKVIEQIRDGIIAGNSLSRAMERTKAFPGELIGLVKVGENTDALPQIFSNYAEYLDWVIRLQKEVKQALSYPIFVTVVMIFTIGIMFGYIIPQVLPAIKALGLKEYPLPTKILMWSGTFVKTFWKQIIAYPIILAIVTKIVIKKSKKIRFFIDKIKLKLPVMGPIFTKASLSRDMKAIAEVYRSGGTLLHAVELIIDHVEQNLFLKKVFTEVKEHMLSGSMLSEAMRNANFFEPPIIRMVKLGEDTGALDRSLTRLAEIYEDDMRRRIQTMTMIIEPTLQLILGVILGIIALGILMPVYNVISRIGSGY